MYDIRGMSDYHTHSLLCGHAEGTPADYVRVAEARGLAEIALTDHAPAPDGYDPVHRMAPHLFNVYRDWVEHAQRTSENLTVLFGVEADYYEGGMEALRRWLDEHPFDVVLGSVHYLDYGNPDYPSLFAVDRPDNIEHIWSLYFERMVGMAQTGLFDVATHIDLPKKSGLRMDGKAICRLAESALDALAEAGMAIEINTSGYTHAVGEAYPSPALLAAARSRDIPIVFGSDAHRPERVGADFDRAAQRARDAGYTTTVRYRKRQRTVVPLGGPVRPA